MRDTHATLHRIRNSGNLPHQRTGSRTDTAFRNDLTAGTIARIICHLRIRSCITPTNRFEIENHCGRNDGNNAVANGEAASALFHPAHYTRGGVQSICGSASQQQCIGAVDEMFRHAGRQLPRSTCSTEQSRSASKGMLDAANHRASGAAILIRCMSDRETQLPPVHS